MHETQIDCIRVGKVKSRRRSRKEQAKKIGKMLADSATIFAITMCTGCIAGMGFGLGMALMAAWI